MFKILLFWLKYKKVNIMSVEQYNAGMMYLQELDVNTIQEMSLSDIQNNDFSKYVSLFKEKEGFDVLTHIASCAIKPRFKRWKKTSRIKYAKDISRDINLTLNLSGFFLSNFGLKFPILGNCLIQLAKIKTTNDPQKVKPNS